MKVLVTGGRKFTDTEAGFAFLLKVHAMFDITEIVVGDATGADTIAVWFAELMNIPFTIHKADWKKHDNHAGRVRNFQMLAKSKPDLIAALPGGTGTTNMILTAKKHGYPVVTSWLEDKFLRPL